jgi:hypothetical protein
MLGPSPAQRCPADPSDYRDDDSSKDGATSGAVKVCNRLQIPARLPYAAVTGQRAQPQSAVEGTNEDTI